MSFPAHISVWSSQFANASMLGVLEYMQATGTSNQFGGIGSGKFTFYYSPEQGQANNLLAHNRIDWYAYQDTTSSTANTGAGSLNVHDSTRFSVGDNICIYDGINQDFVVVTARPSDTAITVTPAITHSYNLGASVLVMRYRGLISAVEKHFDNDHYVSVDTIGYSSQFTNLVVETLVINAKECGWTIYNLLQKYAGNLDLILMASNFLMTTDSGGAVNGTGTNIAYNTNSGQRDLQSTIQDVITIANGNASDTTYSLYVDLNNVVHFGVLPTAPNKTFNMTHCNTSVDGVDNVIPVQGYIKHDNDATNLINTYKLVGGADPSNNSQNVQCIVHDATSVNQYGQIEKQVSLPYITNTTTLQNYGVGLLNQTAYPQTEIDLTLSPVKNFVNPWDCVQVTGYTDGSSDTFNVQSVETSCTVGSDIKQVIKGANLFPNITAIMASIAGQHYIPTTGLLAASTNFVDRYLVTGCIASLSTDQTTLNISAGILNANVKVNGVQTLTEFDTAAASFKPGDDGTYTVGYVYRDGNYAQLPVPYWSIYAGATANGNPFADFQVMPMYRITRLGGIIVGEVFVGNNGGIGQPNIVPGAISAKQLAANPHPTVAPVLTANTVPTVTYLSTGSGAYDVSVDFTLSPPASASTWLSGYRMYTCPASAAFAGNASPQGDYAPFITATTQSVITGLAAGYQYDVYVAYVDIASFVSAPLKLATTSPNAQVISLASLPTMPVNTSPVLSASATITYPNVGSATFDADAQLKLLPPGIDSTPWLVFLEAVAQARPQTGSLTNNWTVYNTVVASTDGTYIIPYGGLGAGTQWTLGLRFVDGQDNRSAVTVVGTTAANPIQGSAIALAAIGSQNLGSSILDQTGGLAYALAPQSMKTVVSSGGQLIFSSGNVIGTLPYANHGAAFTATIAASANPTSSSFVTANAIGTPQILSQSIFSAQIATTRYNTSLVNTVNGTGTLWNNGSAAVNSSSVNADGTTLTYNIGNATDGGSAVVAPDTLTLAPNSSTQLNFRHGKYTSGVGEINVQFQGLSVGTGGNILNTNPLSGNDQCTITNSGAVPHYANAAAARSIGTFTSSTSVQPVANTSYTVNQHNSGYVNAAARGGNSTATITGANSIHAVSTPITGTLTMPACSTGEGANSTQVYFVNSGGGNSATQTFTLSVTTPPSWTYPVIINPGASFTGNTNLETTTFHMTVTDGAGATQVSTISYSAVGVTTGATGTWTVTIYASAVANGAASQNVGTTTPTVQLNGSISGYSGSVNYNTTSGPARWFYQFPANTLAPTSPSTQLNLHITNIAPAVDGNGTGVPCMYLANPQNNTVLASWQNVQANTDYTYYAAGATGGAYCVFFYTQLTTINNTGGGTYTANADTSGFTWYQSDPYTAYTYTNAQGPSSSYQTDAATLPPTTAATAITLAITSLTTPADGYGSSYVEAILKDVNGNVWVNEVLTTGTFAFYNVGAPAGQYTWTLYGSCVPNGAGGPSTYNTTAAGSYGYYVAVNNPTTTFYNNSGQAVQYITPASTIAPTTANTALSLSLSGVNAPANSAGTPYIVTVLQAPNGTYVTFQFSGDGGNTWNNVGSIAQFSPYPNGNTTGPSQYRYFAPGAAAGTYTWWVYSQVLNNGTNNSQYACSWSGNYGYYLVGATGGNTYVLSLDGVTQRLASADGNIDFVKLTQDTVSFQVYNSAGVNQSFQIAIDAHGL